MKEHLRITLHIKLSLTVETNELTQSRTTHKGGLGCVCDLYRKYLKNTIRVFMSLLLHKFIVG